MRDTKVSSGMLPWSFRLEFKLFHVMGLAKNGNVEFSAIACELELVTNAADANEISPHPTAPFQF